MMKKGMIIVSFGTSFESSYKRDIEPLELDLKSFYAENDFEKSNILTAFSSEFIRSKVKRQRDLLIHNVKSAMEQLIDEGINDIYVKPLHIIPGIEIEKIKKQILDVKKDHPSINCYMSLPLLTSEESIENVAKMLAEDDCVNNDDLVLYMAHGTSHKADKLYHQLYEGLQKINQNIFLASVEGDLSFSKVLETINKGSNRCITLKPFMIVAGDHAMNDMAGDEDSWKVELIEQGFQVTCVIEGLGCSKVLQNYHHQKLNDFIELVE